MTFRTTIVQLILTLTILVLAGDLRAQGADYRVDVQVGYFAEKPAERPRRIDLNGRYYFLNVATVPPDRMLIRRSKVIFIDQFPDGADLFRDDMEAFHKMIFDGGLLVLVAGPDAPQQVTDNFNYLGTRFDFEWTGSAVEGSIEPVHVRQGPLGGNVWHPNRGASTLSLNAPEWRVHLKAARTGEPVVASRRIGEGMLLLVGTDEIDRQSGNRVHNALTLIDWGIGEVETPTDWAAADRAMTRRTNVNAGRQAAPVSEAERRRVLQNPSSDLLTERVAELSRVLQVTEPDVDLSEVLIPPVRREYFPYDAVMEDLNGSLFQVRDYSGLPFLAVVFAPWDPESQQFIRNWKDMLERIRGISIPILGVPIDHREDAVRNFAADHGLDWRILFEPVGWNHELARELDLRQLPQVILVDRQGRIAAKDLPWPLMEEAIGVVRME